MHYPPYLLKLMESIKRLPGVGGRSAERFVFEMLSWSPDQLREMGHLIAELPVHVERCETCGALRHDRRCVFCEDTRRDRRLVCVVATPRDLFALERTGEFRGIYHVLGGLLSPLDGRGPEWLAIEGLLARISSLAIEEVVIALDSTLEGDATALYLRQQLSTHPVRISRLAFGLPMGSSLEYVDGDTLARAFSGRQEVP